MIGVLLWLAFGVFVGRASDPPLILVSFDGFRWDYMDHIHTPNIHGVIQRGFRVKRLTPAFPSLTFPNHYTLVTGMNPAHHGLVGNTMFDENGSRRYDKGNAEAVADPTWYEASSIWEAAREHGLTTASYFWVGSEAKGRQPDHFVSYRRNVPIEDRLSQLARWLDQSTPPNPRLILLYFEITDDMGHQYGPDSTQLIDGVRTVDWIVGQITDISRRKAVEPNMVFVSDHGMTPMGGLRLPAKQIEQAVGTDDLKALVNNYSQVDIFLEDASDENVKTVLARLPQLPSITWFLRGEHPALLHTSRNGHIVGLMAPGSEFAENMDYAIRGGHGYDPDFIDMGAICFGSGPGIRQGGILDSARSIDVFPLLAHLLGLPQRKVDGDFKTWRAILKN